MTEQAIDRRRGSQSVDHDSSDCASEQIPTALTKADQFAWEAPNLRPIKVKFDDKPMMLASPCPDWCSQKGAGHDPEAMLALSRSRRQREHESLPLRVALEMLYPYESRSGAKWGHLELRLVRTARNDSPRVKIVEHYGDGQSEHREWEVGTLWFDEVRELIAVLQHLLKVGKES